MSWNSHVVLVVLLCALLRGWFYRVGWYLQHLGKGCGLSEAHACQAVVVAAAAAA
jgi:uncharacterized membrane protein (UPF0136 family)